MAQAKGVAPILVVSAAEEKEDVIQTKQIKSYNPPKTIQDAKSWALINLIATLLTFIIAILLLIMAWINKRKENDDVKIKNHMIKRIISIVVAIISGFIFLITEDITLPMVLIDQWTLIMIVIFLIQIVIMILCKHKKQENE